MPAHITALYPFLPTGQLTDNVQTRLAELCGAVPRLEVQFRRTARFPDAVYLDPEPASELARLTAAIAATWPETPPYGGVFAEIVPHLTVAQGVSEAVLHEIETDLAPVLPIRTLLTCAQVFVRQGDRWRPGLTLPFGSKH